MRYKTNLLPAIFLLQTVMLSAQVQVSKEPMHKKVLQNKYIRLLDVWIQPGDTSLFHIHSTPSVFLVFTTTSGVSQINGADWKNDQYAKGQSWYRSFFRDTLVHRVGNTDTVPLHVTDVELLSTYQPGVTLNALPFPVLYENERVFAYQFTDSSFNHSLIANRGPMVAELVEGEDVMYYDVKRKKSTMIKAGKYLYIKPGSAFYLKAQGKEKMLLVLFEIK